MENQTDVDNQRADNREISSVNEKIKVQIYKNKKLFLDSTTAPRK